MSFNKRSISVVIPNYNGRYLLEQNLPSVLDALEYYSKGQGSCEIIISDDNSTDTSVEFLEQNYPQIIVIRGKKNLGFSGNINRGIYACKGDLVLLLNSDVAIYNDYLNKLVDYFNDPEVFGVIGAIYDKDEVTDAMKLCQLTWWGQILGTKNYFSRKGHAPSLFLSGACALVDRNKLMTLGGFCELYSPFYGEDLDLGIRSLRMGWRNYYEPSAKCIHPPSQTISKFKKSKISLISRRNRFIMHHIHLYGFAIIIWYFKVVLDLVTRWVVFDKNYYSSFYLFLKMYKQVHNRKKDFSNLLRTYSKDPQNTKVILGQFQKLQKSYIDNDKKEHS